MLRLFEIGENYFGGVDPTSPSGADPQKIFRVSEIQKRLFVEKGKHFQILFSLLVRSRTHLSEVIRNLRKVKSVVHVKRSVCH